MLTLVKLGGTALAVKTVLANLGALVAAAAALRFGAQ